MNLADVNRGIHKHKKRKRVGRGAGSGHGKTSGRGHKGQGQLAGWSAPPIFEGGASPLIRRIPKRGFNNAFAKIVVAVNLGALDDAFKSGDDVTVDALRAKDLVSGRFDQVKILGDGKLTKKLKITAHRFSASALEKIQQAGGEAVVLPGKKHPSEMAGKMGAKKSKKA
ncbi:MAG: 50S ribosomal protein L15 [Pirellulales bacterium]